MKLLFFVAGQRINWFSISELVICVRNVDWPFLQSATRLDGVIVCLLVLSFFQSHFLKWLHQIETFMNKCKTEMEKKQHHLCWLDGSRLLMRRKIAILWVPFGFFAKSTLKFAGIDVYTHILVGEYAIDRKQTKYQHSQIIYNWNLNERKKSKLQN